MLHFLPIPIYSLDPRALWNMGVNSTNRFFWDVFILFCLMLALFTRMETSIT